MTDAESALSTAAVAPPHSAGAGSAHEWFESEAAARPESIAVVEGDRRLTYGELNSEANQLARYLLRAGVGPDRRVAVLLPRSGELVVALLAILKAGGAYLPLDSTHPAARTMEVLRDSEPVALMTFGSVWNPIASGFAPKALVPPLLRCVVDFQAKERPWCNEPAGNVAREETSVDPNQIAYVIYTSGSTGAPKGVANTHAGLLNRLGWFVDSIAVDTPVAALKTSIGFVDSVTEILQTLLAGGRLVVFDGAAVRDPVRFVRQVREHGVNTLVVVPSFLVQLLDVPEAALASIELVVCSGEPLPSTLASRFLAAVPRAKLFNFYGSSEVNGDATAHQCGLGPADTAGAGSIIGRPIRNLRAYVLDEQRRPVPRGQRGELFIGGSGLARGYLNRPTLTAEAFLPDPFSAEPEARMYKTGDVGRYLADGSIEFLGRTDHQVKIRGFRVELGEIEARLGACEGVKEVVVLAREDTPGEKRLVAYYTEPGVAGDGQQAQAPTRRSVHELREQLAAQLPEYMVPAAFVALPALPLTPNGKVDRKALPRPQASGFASKEYEAPQGEIETALARVWSEVLGVQRVGRRDHFFELGGHSLMAVRVVSRVRQRLGVEVDLGEVFDKPELSAFAQALQSTVRSKLPPIEPLARDQPLALSFAQQRLWFLSQMEGVSQAYHIPMAVWFNGVLNGTALRRTLDRLLARHEALRTTFIAVDGEPAQHIAPADIGFVLQHHDLRGNADPGEAQQALQRLIEQEAREAFDLQTGPLIRGRLIRRADTEHVLLITMHHIVSDGWSMDVLSGELSALYRAFSQGQEDPLPALSVQYADFAAWQRRWLRGEVLHTQSQYWRRTLAGAPELIELPTDRPRPQRQDHAGASVAVEFDATLSAGLKALGQRHGATPFMTLLAAWAIVLKRLSGQGDVVIGTPVANRARAELEPLIGFFVNTLALRLNGEGSSSVAQWLQHTKAQALGAQRHQELPFEQVVEMMRPTRSLAHGPLFQVMFAWEGQDTPLLELPGLQIEARELPQTMAKFDLTLTLRERGGCIQGSLGYASALYERETIERHVEYLRCIAQAMVHDDATAIDRLNILPEALRHKLLVEWNDTRREYPDTHCVHELFEAQVARQPDAIAVKHGEREVSYAQLNAMANRLAHRLRSLGVGPDDRVAILMERSIELVMAQLAILKCGAVYVPLDVEMPLGRLTFMIEDSGCALLVSESTATAPSLPTLARINLDDGPADGPHHGRAADVSCRSAACVMYTSGSTGQPNGVIVPHRAIVRLVVNGAYAEFSPRDRFAFAANPAFDASTLEVWGALLNGGEIVVVDRGVLLDPARFAQTLQAAGVSVLWLTVGLFNQFADELAGVIRGLRYLIVGGDTLDPRVMARVLRKGRPRHLLNGYGPTESTTFATTFEIDSIDDESARIPIGRPIANTRVYILDHHAEPVPTGVAGELFIAGAGLALGYLNRPELSAERFLPDPFSAEPEARMYKTGDVGRYLADGSIEFLGRTDHQVKIRGFRVELGEIEARLGACEGVKEVVVLAREDTPGEKRLVAYYTEPGVAGDGQQAQAPTRRSVHELREQLAAQLPEYMVPAAFVALPALPLTPNGKVDRKALPRPQASGFASKEYEAPQGEIETALARVWSEVLGVQRVGRRDHFFELGGHSLMAVRVVSRVRQRLGVEVDLGEVFDKPELSAFAQALQSTVRSKLPPIEPLARDQPLALSFAQQRLWFLSQMEGVSQAYHIPMAVWFNGVLNGTALRRTLDRLLARHEALRTTFIAVDGEPAQHIAPADIGFVLQHHDLRGNADPGEAQQALQRLIEQEAREAFDLQTGPLIRGRLIRRADTEHVLLITMHHIVSDGWSMDVLSGELSALYRAFSQGQEDPLPALSVQYADFAAWQRRWLRGEVLHTQSQYWRRTLAGAPELIELPTDRPRPQRQDHAGASVAVEFDATLSAGLKALGQRHGATPFMTLLAAWAIVLKRLSGQGDVVIGTPVANRARAELEPLIGFFVNTLALRLNGEGSSSVAQWLQHTKAQALGAQRHQELPFEQVVEMMRPTRSLAHGPLFQVMFAWEGQDTPLLELPGLQIEARELPQTMAKFDLTLTLRERGGCIQGSLGYASALYERETIERHVEYLRCIAQAMVHDDATAIDRLNILPEALRHKLLVEWNDTRREYPDTHCVHELFEAQVARQPDAIAVKHGEREVSYAQLNAMANRLAHRLRSLGVGPDDRVAILMERRVEMIVALLATLKAGGAYVPLDPAYPAPRLGFMLEDAAPKVILTQSVLRAELSRHWASGAKAHLQGATVLELDGGLSELGDESDRDAGQAINGLELHHLAYVIYTSGSTGNPKAAEVTQAGMRNVVAWYVDDLGLRADDALLLLTSYSFDLTQKNIYGPLVVGATLHLADEPFDPSSILRQIRREQISTFNLTPSAFRLLVDADAQRALSGVRRVVLGGEPIQLGQLLRVHVPRPEFVNGYGPTECSGVVASHRLRRDLDGYANDSVPLGKPIRNLRLYVLDPHEQPVPIGARGEVYIGGLGVGRGYRNQPELTQLRFVPDPYSPDPGSRMYKTGDIARHRAEGSVEFLGRSDFQVKVRGFRIELGEIEATLSACAGVREAVVLARDHAHGEKRLVAYYTQRTAPFGVGHEQEAASLGVDALREQLAAKLPNHMVPAAFVAMSSLPLTPNGKVDRDALPAPEEGAYASRTFEAPLGEIEASLARIWAEVLGLQRIGRHDNFFELGGHSLTATQVVSRVRRDWGVKLPLRVVFERSSLQGLASRLRTELNSGVEQPAEVAPVKRIGERRVALATSFSQRRMWLVQQLNPRTTAYNISLSLRFEGTLNADTMVSALQFVAQRHEAFRTRFVAVDGEPMQWIGDPLQAAVEYIDLRDAPNDVRAGLARKRVSEIVSRPYDLSVAGLHRVALLQLGVQEHVLLWTMHHAIGDQWSFGILLRELREVYGALMSGNSPVLPALDLDYSDYAAWQREQTSSTASRQQMAYWRKRLAGVRPLALPTDFPRYGLLEGRGGEVHLRPPPAWVDRLKKFSQGQGVTPFMMLLACFKVLMVRISGRPDVAVAAPIANRLGVQSESLVGTLVNTLVMRADLSGPPTFSGLLSQVRETALEAYANQEVSFERLVEEVDTARDPMRAPLAQVMFNLINAPFSLDRFADLNVELFEFEQPAAQLELSITVDLSDDAAEVQLRFAVELFARATAERLLGSFMTLVQGVLAEPHRRIDAYDLSGDAQRLELAQWNDTIRPFGSHCNLADRLGAQVISRSSKVALQSDATLLTYAALDAGSNRLARELRARGISKGALVGLCVERNGAMVVAQLAILKAGAAYVPLDPAYPPERLSMMAHDARIALLVTQSAQAHALPWPREQSLWLDGDADRIAAHSGDALEPDAALDADLFDPAYVIYTSGSTGRPKGVAVPHGAVLNFLASMAREPGLGPEDRLLAVTTLSFDIAVLELLLPLSVGATVVLASTDQALDGRALRALLEQHRITVMQATPSSWRMLVDAGWPGTPGFKALIGGEALPPDLAGQLLERVGELWNMYGPTETTVWSTCWRVTQPDKGICIGRPIANTQVHVLDAAGQVCPIGVPGELHIGGAGVALGYLHRQDLTDERFIADRFSAVPNARLYKTGDLGRWRYDGQLEHMGRLDHQVKIRGHRVELGEIEAGLVSHSGVARAVVIVREDRPGDARLTAYIVARGAMPEAAALRDHLRSMLPQYMIPQHLVALESIPLLPNGKLDRAQLPPPNETLAEPRTGSGLTTPEERAIAAVWERLLEIDGAEREDNFFDLGGHSLLAVRAAGEIEQATGRHVSPRRLIFETLAQLAATPPQDGAGSRAGAAAPPEPAVPSLRRRLAGGLKKLLGDK